MYYAVKKITKAIPEEITQVFPKEHRAREFYSSRLALADCLGQMDNREIPSLLNLKSSDHQSLDCDKSVILSLSHTKEYGAAICATTSEYLSVGIDIELKDRKLKKGIEKMFINKKDKITELLVLWCKKEAAFKALYPLTPLSKALVLKDIWIKENQFGIDERVWGTVNMFEIDNSLFTAIANIPIMIK